MTPALSVAILSMYCIHCKMNVLFTVLEMAFPCKIQMNAQNPCQAMSTNILNVTRKKLDFFSLAIVESYFFSCFYFSPKCSNIPLNFLLLHALDTDATNAFASLKLLAIEASKRQSTHPRTSHPIRFQCMWCMYIPAEYNRNE